MARIHTEKIVLSLSTIVKDKESEPKEMISVEKLSTLMEAVEEIIDNKTIIVEISAE
jgi:hypothetical protein